jgi:hypothetical protein
MAGSIPDGVIKFFYRHNPSGRTIVLGLTRPLTERSKGKGKAVPLQAWSGPEGSRKLRFPDFMTSAHEGGKVVQPGIFPGGKGGQCVGLTTLLPSCAECLEIWESQPPGNFWACPGLLWDCFTFITDLYIYIYIHTHVNK